MCYAPAARAQQTCTSGPFVNGMDISDDQGDIAWADVAADTSSNIGWVYMKATQGTYDVDSTLADNWPGAKGVNIVRGAYHFFDPTISGTDQASYFVAAVNSAGGFEATDLPPMLDIECPDGSSDCLGTGSSGAASGSQVTTYMNEWLTAVQAATGRTPVIYSSGDYFTSAGVDTTGLQDYPLFIAYPTTSGCFNYMAPWSGATLWQYSWTGTVGGISGSGEVDLDYFLGTKAQLTSFLGTGVTPIVDGGVTGTADAGTGVGVPCTVSATGDMGTCLLTSTCMTLGGTATPDYCPGATDVQCCTGFTDDAGTDATVGSGTGTSGGSGTGTGVGSGVGTGIGTGVGTSQGDGGTAQGGTLDGGPSSTSSRDGATDGSEPGEDGSAPSSGGCAVATHDGRGDAGGASAALLVLGAVMIRKRKRAVAQ
jgi:GH25 family lysozyme M1 (1,4-beta-N-acetylmuramidase)